MADFTLSTSFLRTAGQITLEAVFGVCSQYLAGEGLIISTTLHGRAPFVMALKGHGSPTPWDGNKFASSTRVTTPGRTTSFSCTTIFSSPGRPRLGVQPLPQWGSIQHNSMVHSAHATMLSSSVPTRLSGRARGSYRSRHCASPGTSKNSPEIPT